MKSVLKIIILSLAFCLAVFAQSDEEIPKRIGDPVDKFGRLTRDDLKARIDGFFTELQQDPNAEGLIVIEFDEKDSRNKKIAWLKVFDQCFNFRKVDRTRFTFIISESSSELTTLWVVPEGASLENSSDNNKKKMIKGENLRQEMKTIFNKK